MTQTSLLCLVAGLLATLAGCGAGTAAIASLAGDGSGDDTPVVVRSLVVGTGPADRKTSPVTVSFELVHPDGRDSDVRLSIATPGPSASLTLVGTTSLDDVESSAAGVVHTRLWDFAADLPAGSGTTPGVIVVVRVLQGGSTVSAAPVELGNDPPAITGLGLPAGEVAGPVRADFVLSDSSGDLCSVLVEYDDLGDAAGYLPATMLGDTSGLAATAAGVPITLFWDVETDAPDREFDARLRLVADDGTATGAAVTADVRVDNNAAPVAIVDGSAFVASPDARRGLVAPLQLVDPEGDAIQVVFQWREPGGSYPSLPATAAGLAVVLADPCLRRQHAIATEIPTTFAGRLDPVGASAVRWVGADAERSAALARGVVGRSIGLLRATGAPAPVAGGWVANPLRSPVAVLPIGDGIEGLVLDEPSPGTWRLQVVDLATGATPGPVVSGVPGTPTALAWDPTERPPGSEWVLVAHETAGTWRVDRVALDDGTTTNLISADGSTVLGPIRALAPTSANGAAATVGDALLALDWSDLGAPTETLSIGDFASAWGIAVDGTRANHMFVAERDWVNPTNGMVEGRVVGVDLTNLVRIPVPTQGAPFARPEALAIESDGRLLAVVDDDPLDGVKSIRGSDLEGAGAGATFDVITGLGGPAGLATGPRGMRVVALHASDDVAIAGGVEQRRVIGSLDPTGGEVQVTQPFDPAPFAGQIWNLDVTVATIPAGGFERHAFVWDTSDLGGSGEVVLRAVPYDVERGLATDTGIPRPVRVGLDVIPETLGGPGTTDGAAAVVVVDLDGDGRDDLAIANRDADTITVFHQRAAGGFPTVPDATLTEIPVLAPIDAPVALVAVDVDDDGILDLVSANRDSDNLTVFRQVAAGSYATEALSIGGVVAPTSIAVGDLDGDGATDLAVASSGTDRIAVFFQLGGGLFGAVPDVELGDASTLSPEGVTVADLDGDGDLDVLAAERGADRATIHWQTAPGILSTSPDVVLGGPGETDGPISVFVADVDRDGDPDVVTANFDGNDLTVFRRGPTGLYPASPTDRLSGSPGPVAPVAVLAADVDRDGLIEVVSSNAGGNLTVYDYVPDTDGFRPQPTHLEAPVGPLGFAVGELGGGVGVDLAAADAAADELLLFLATSAGSFRGPAPDRLLGGSATTSSPGGLAVADLDADGDLDVVISNQGGNSLAVFDQLGPAFLAASPSAILGSAVDTPGPTSVGAADIDGDGLVDLACANGAGGTIAVFFQAPDNTFPAVPDAVLGAGVLGGPSGLRIVDVDGDGDRDLVVAESTANRIAVFLQSGAGSFPAVPDLAIGGPASTVGPESLVAMDLDGDGDVDVACANVGSDDVTVFLQSGGSFPATPDAVLGGAGVTDDPRSLLADDLDGDGDLDLACANSGGDRVTVFLQSVAGAFASVPSAVVTDALLLNPATLAAADLDLDGDLDLVVGSDGSSAYVVARQTTPASFSVDAAVVGGPGATDGPRGLTACDFDGDGDVDLIGVHPSLDTAGVFFGSH